MIYIKLEENLYKFIDVKYEKIPKIIKGVLFKIKYKSNNILNKKVCNGELIILPTINKKIINFSYYIHWISFNIIIKLII